MRTSFVILILTYGESLFLSCYYTCFTTLYSQVLVTDIRAHEDRIKELDARADEFIRSGAWDADMVRERKKMINERYEKVNDLLH